MLEELLLREARRRREIFKNLPMHLKELSMFLKKMDGGSRIFSSAQRQGGVHVLMSDVDILIKTKLKPREVIAKLRSEGFDEPFEFHVVNEKEFKIYKDMIPELREI